MSGHTPWREVTTSLRGYDRWELLSLLQKAIRRGSLKYAMAAAAEMDQSGWTDTVWDRLEIIVSEDIGPMERGLATEIATLRTTADKYRTKGRRTARLMLMHAVSALCLADKSRLADNAAHALYGRPTSEIGEIPDWALDKHTRRGRQMGRGDVHFWDQGALTAEVLDPLLSLRQAEDGYLADWKSTTPHVHEAWWDTQRKDKDAPVGQSPDEDAAEKGRMF